MSGISRRSVLGYTGTAAAGTILATAATAQSAQAAQPGETASASAPHTAPATAHAQQAGASTADFPFGTTFTGNVSPTLPGGEDNSNLSITFTVQCTEAPAAYDVTPLEIANALSAYAQSRGWPAITFYGAPAPVALN
ncbi:hypothetical protein SAMN05216223_105376 [Actinacidiphila yanglinensis]|uniref:Tat (Twin-arginine translocation) pathway signal sequence n=1 Tax=Actinacidiphila yanglinensis TaxID=310779 RepID=A0A1H6AF99_9ACTN|nr:hypothetical protein [Actinacidiphila yanglinensis]SEG47429.1 hypothetical protein SAMN05216223_105376 [Actinacidiphila yanglinensis]